MLFLLLALLGSAQAQDLQNGTAASQPYQSFAGSPMIPEMVQPPTDPASLTPGHILIAPRYPANNTFTDGPLIVDSDLQPVWMGAAAPFSFGQSMSFQVGQYKGEEVIALWQGQFNAGGYGSGRGLLLNSSYDVVANITTDIEGAGIDFHEFHLTDNDTALYTVYHAEEYDLSSYNLTTEDGSQGWILNNYVQEIEIETGNVIFSWNALDHIPTNQGFAYPGATGVSQASAWDFLHLNSIRKDSQGNYLISSRHYHAIWYLAPDGSIIWQLGGVNSTVERDPEVSFQYQHDAEWIEEGQVLSLFDNAASTWEDSAEQARGMVVNINQEANTASLAQAYYPYANETSPSQGSFERQPNGNYLAGWGSQPWMSEYAEDGTLLWAARYPENVQSYRALRANWTGQPSFPPSFAVNTNSTSGDNSNNTVQVYMSWNGATEVNSYNVYHAANESDEGTKVEQGIRKAGFETMGEVNVEDGWFGANDVWMWVKAVNAQGEEIGGTSEKVKVSKSDAGLSAEGGVKGGEDGGAQNSGGNGGSGDNGSNSSETQGNGASASMTLGSLIVVGAAVFSALFVLL